MGSLKLFIFAEVCVCVVFAATTIPLLPKGCTYNGKTYHTGESFQPSPCEHCYCSGSGMPACAIADCFVVPCVDSVRDPTKCCPVCPNGENCKHQDGTIIKKGETYKPDADTTCMCPQNTFGFHGNMAMCLTRAPQPVTVQAVS